jgi:hypothetical protein
MQVKGKLQSLQRDYEKQYNELIETRKKLAELKNVG